MPVLRCLTLTRNAHRHLCVCEFVDLHFILSLDIKLKHTPPELQPYLTLQSVGIEPVEAG